VIVAEESSTGSSGLHVGDLDMTGIGKAMQAIPNKSYNMVVSTATSTFRSVLRPITATTEGAGRYIEACFDEWTDRKKVAAAAALKAAAEKADEANKERNPTPYARVLVLALDAATDDGDPLISELWQNLIANELTSGGVHPRFVRILRDLAPSDAHRLVKLVEETEVRKHKGWLLTFARALGSTLDPIGIGGPVRFGAVSAFGDSRDFTWVHLEELGLVEWQDGLWRLSIVGRAFIEAVTDPTIDVPDVTKDLVSAQAPHGT
jgi:hypothetical protein